MPRYQVEIDGKRYVIEGERPPTEAEAREAVGAYKPAAPVSNKEMSTEQLQTANLKNRPDLPSTTGFLKNVVSSGTQFVTDAVKGIPQIAKMGAGAVRAQVDPAYLRQTAMQVGESAPVALKAIVDAAKKRYGGVNEALSTAYRDPAGVAGDISTVAGGIGLVSKAGGLGKVAKIANAISDATNPLSIPGKLVAGATHGAANAVVRGSLRPPASVRQDFGGSKNIADAVLKDRVYSEASAGRKLGQSTAQADQMLADAQAAGVPGVPRMNVARAVVGKPQQTAQLRTRLGVPDQSPDLVETAKGILRNNPKEIPLTEAQALKREAQDLAYEAGADNLTVKKAAEIEKAKALRAGIESRVPAVGPVNERSQRLLGSKLAFANAQDRPRALTHFLSVLGGAGGFAGGGPAGALLVPALIEAMDSPRAGALAGIGLDAFGQGMNANSLRKAALISRLLENVPDQ